MPKKQFSHPMLIDNTVNNPKVNIGFMPVKNAKLNFMPKACDRLPVKLLLV